MRASRAFRGTDPPHMYSQVTHRPPPPPLRASGGSGDSEHERRWWVGVGSGGWSTAERALGRWRHARRLHPSLRTIAGGGAAARGRRNARGGRGARGWAWRAAERWEGVRIGAIERDPPHARADAAAARAAACTVATSSATAHVGACSTRGGRGSGRSGGGGGEPRVQLLCQPHSRARVGGRLRREETLEDGREHTRDLGEKRFENRKLNSKDKVPR